MDQDNSRCPCKRLRVTDDEQKTEETGAPLSNEFGFEDNIVHVSSESTLLHNENNAADCHVGGREFFAVLSHRAASHPSQNVETYDSGNTPVSLSETSQCLNKVVDADGDLNEIIELGEHLKVLVESNACAEETGNRNVDNSKDKYTDCHELDSQKQEHKEELANKHGSMLQYGSEGSHSDVISENLAVLSNSQGHQGVSDNEEINGNMIREEISTMDYDSLPGPSCRFVQNIQALAQNNYLKVRGNSPSLYTDAGHIPKGENKQSIALAKKDNLSNITQSGTGCVSMQNENHEHVSNMEKEFDVGPFEYEEMDKESVACDNSEQENVGDVRKDTESVFIHERPVGSDCDNFGATGDASRGKIVSESQTSLTSGQMSRSSDHRVKLGHSEYFNMLTLPVTIGGQGHRNIDVNKQPMQSTSLDTTSSNNEDRNSDFGMDIPGRSGWECFKLDDFQSTSETNINYLPASILIQIFGNLSVFDLLRRLNRICKYWYNLCRDPDLWTNINLVNQHRLTDPDLWKLVYISKERIRCINLTDCRFITNDGVKMLITACHCLQVLKLMRCFYVTDVAFNTMLRDGLCKNLHALYLDGCCNITDNTVVKVAQCCPLMRYLQLNQCTKVSDVGIIELAQGCPQLRQLQLDHCSRVTDEGLSKLVLGCPDLRYLNLMSCGISDVGVKYLSRLTKLSNIDLSNIPRLLPDSVVYMSKYCKNLQCVNVSLNAVVSDDCITQLAVNLPKLKRLYCVSCNISDRGLEELAKHCPTLEALDVGWCQDITDHGIRAISFSCAQLDYLGLIRCDKITIETIEELAIRFPRINYSTFVLESRRLLERARREGYRFEMTAP